MTRVSTAPTLSIAQCALLVTLALALFALNALVMYNMLTSRAPIAVWDFHSSWVGLRAMLRDGADPYSDEVLLAIQKQIYGRPARPNEDQVAFAYPLHVIVVVGPLALLPLSIAQALWLSLLEASLLTFIVIAPRAVGWRPPTWLLALTVLFTLASYSNAWAIMLGQISIVVAAFVALAWWGLRTGRWRLAGTCLALATIKPQIPFLLVPGLLAWAVYRRRWRLVVTFVVVFGALILLPVLWLPAWPLSWLAAADRYFDYTIFKPPLVMLARSAWLARAIAALLLIWTASRWWRTPEREGAAFDWALGMLIVVSALIAPRTSHVNQLVLLLPLFFIFTHLSSTGVIAAVEIGLLAGLWLMDLALPHPASGPQHTVWQHQFISPILPVGLALALLRLSPRPARKGS